MNKIGSYTHQYLSRTETYYKLQSVFNTERSAYIPVLEHKTLLRELLTAEEATIFKEGESFTNMPEIEQQEIEYVLNKLE